LKKDYLPRLSNSSIESFLDFGLYTIIVLAWIATIIIVYVRCWSDYKQVCVTWLKFELKFLQIEI